MAGFLSGGKIEYGLIPLGMIGLTVFAVVLSRAGLGTTGFALNLGLLGFFGGFYNVPVNAIMQHRPDADNKGKVIAAGAWLSWVGVLVASGFYYLFAEAFHLTPPQIFLAGAGLSLAGTIYCVVLMPDTLIRLILWLVTKTIYRIRIVGRDFIPEKGGALFVCNHVSFVDAPLLMASTDRKIRFIMDQSYYERWWIKPFSGILGLIPIASNFGPRELLKSLQTRGRLRPRRPRRLHFCRGKNHAHRRTGRISARLRTHHEKRGRARRARRARRRLGQHLQLRTREIFLEMAASHFLSRHRALRPAAVFNRDHRGNSRRRGKTFRHGFHGLTRI